MEVDVPLTTRVYRNIDESMARDNAARMIDGYLDEEANMNSRPGFEHLFTVGILIPSASYDVIDGLFWWSHQSRLVILSNGYLWYATTADQSDGTFGIGDLMGNVGTKASFATDGTKLYVANGGRIYHVQVAGVQTVMADADAPTQVTHLGELDGYLLANSVGTKKIFFSELEDGTVWSALDFFSAGSDPDIVVAMHIFQKQIFAFGPLTTEIWQNDGVTPFSRVEGGVIETGCIAPYSIIKTKNSMMWLNSEKRFVKYSGNGIEEISTPYDKDIMNYSTVSDCEGEEIIIDGKSFYKFEFPTIGKTLVYNLSEEDWGEWSYYNTGTGEHERFLGRCYAFSPLFNRHYLGSRKLDGKIFAFNEGEATDAGNPIRMYRLTGKISYGTHKEKINNYFMLRAKRGQATDDSEPVMTLRYRVDGEQWSNEIQLSLGQMADTYNVIKLESLGCYRNIQYEIVASDPVGISYGDAKEDFSVGYS